MRSIFATMHVHKFKCRRSRQPLLQQQNSTLQISFKVFPLDLGQRQRQQLLLLRLSTTLNEVLPPRGLGSDYRRRRRRRRGSKDKLGNIESEVKQTFLSSLLYIASFKVRSWRHCAFNLVMFLVEPLASVIATTLLQFRHMTVKDLFSLPSCIKSPVPPELPDTSAARCPDSKPGRRRLCGRNPLSRCCCARAWYAIALGQ